MNVRGSCSRRCLEGRTPKGPLLLPRSVRYTSSDAQPCPLAMPPSWACPRTRATSAGIRYSSGSSIQQSTSPRCFGAVQQSIDFALAYSVTRQTFRKPIVAHQLVAARLADMLVSAHTIHLVLRSVAAQDTQAQVAPVSQMARHVATEAMDIARDLVQLCGGHGYVEGLPPAARLLTVP